MFRSRAILHVDMDAFFASVEQLDHPHLRGKPVLVGHEGPRGVVAAASYESRAFGCRSAQPMSVARRHCPHAVVMPVRFERYHEMSARVLAVFERMTPLVEPLSIDEAFLDVTGSQRLLGPAVEIARGVKDQIRRDTGLTASVGVASNKFLAKLASDMNKPDGLTVIDPDRVDQILPPLPVGRIWGVGPKSAKRLGDRGIRTIGDLRRMPPAWFDEWFGADGARYYRLAFGRDDRPVTPDREAKTIGQEQTFATDVVEPEKIREVLLAQVEQVAARIRRHSLKTASVVVKIRFGEFQTVTRSRSLAAPTDATADLRQAAWALFDEWAAESFRPVRLIGVAAGKLGPVSEQLELFAHPEGDRQKRLDQAVDRINERFGKSSIRRGPKTREG